MATPRSDVAGQTCHGFQRHAVTRSQHIKKIDSPLTAAAAFSKELGEFILPYDAVRTASDPEAALTAFLDSTYAAAAGRGKWDRANLECAPGQIGKPRAV